MAVARRASGSDGPQAVILVGTGPLARQRYFPALHAMEQRGLVSVRAIVNPPRVKAEATVQEFPDAIRVTAFDALPPLPDALVLVTTPTRFHLAQTNAALRRGWHVVCSSPLASTAAEASLMIASAQRQERILAVDLRSRLFPAARYIRALCDDHLLGPPLSFRVQIGHAPPPAEDPPQSGPFAHPDGALIALGIPCLELLTWFLGNAAILTYADDAMGGVEANAVIELSFRDAVRGSVHLSRDWAVEDTHTFVFERGILRWSGNRANTVTLQLASAPAALTGDLVPAISAVKAPLADWPVASDELACVVQLENVVAAIAGREPLRTPATEAMHSLPLVEACYAQRSPLPQPWLSPNDAAHARAVSPPAALRRS